MAGRGASERKAARLLAAFLNRHLPYGTGNCGEPWKASAFAIQAGIAPSSISEWRNRKGSLPSPPKLRALQSAFFGAAKPSENDPIFREWQEVCRAIANDGLPDTPGLDDKCFSLRQAWGMLTQPASHNTLSLVRFASDSGVDEATSITARMTGAAFILPMPGWFLELLREDTYLREHYDTYPPIDLSAAPDLAEFYRSVPVPDFPAIVAYHSDAYARFVIDTLRQRPTYAPFNKQKVGLYGYQQAQRSGVREGVYLDLDFYRTDYFTHRVMRRVLHDLRASHPALFADTAAPFDKSPFLRYFATSFGINIVATTQEMDGKRFFMARLSDRQGNVNQQERWHVSANEGVSLEDTNHGTVDVDRVVARALCEELGHRFDAQADETIHLEFAIDRQNWEPFISCVTHLGIDRATLYRQKQHLARDDRREFHEVRDFPFTEEAIMRLVLDNPAGTAEFTSFGLNILDSIVVRGLAPASSTTS